MARLTSLPVDTPLITASSGNHGLALATAARLMGHALTVVLPETVAREKLARIQALGVRTILHSRDVGADPNLSHRADRILSQGWKPTLRGSAVDKFSS
jgi:cysteine synthase